MYYVYAVKSKRNDRIYIGSTKDLKRRYREHKLGDAWTTRRMLPVSLIFYEAFVSKEDALRRERYFKSSKGRSTLKMMLRNSL